MVGIEAVYCMKTALMPTEFQFIFGGHRGGGHRGGGHRGCLLYENSLNAHQIYHLYLVGIEVVSIKVVDIKAVGIEAGYPYKRVLALTR